MKKLITATAAAAAVLGTAGAAVASYAVHGKRYSGEEVLQQDLADYPDLRAYAGTAANPLGKEQYIVNSTDGLPLQVRYYAGPEDSRKFVIFVHGFTMNASSMLKYMPFYKEMGYHCICYDQRGHGENDRRTACTFGKKESLDLLRIIEDTYERYGQDILVGLQGESLGSATVIMALKYAPRVRFVVCDCGYSSMKDVLKGRMRKFRIPGILLYPGSAAAALMYGVMPLRVRPVDSLKGNRIPICFIHGSDDLYVKPWHSEKMWRTTEGYSELHIFPGARHALSLYADPVRYRRIVQSFVRKTERTSHIWETSPVSVPGSAYAGAGT